MTSDIKILSQEEIDEKLKNLPGWKLEDNKISKQFEFDGFPEAISFINKMVPFFQEEDHHPDMHISFKKVTFELTRFDVGGKLTQKDFKVAHKIEEEFKA